MTIGSAIVIGGGIVGLVAARALALRGVEVTLIERKPRIEDDGGLGLGIQNNAMNAFAEIGVAQAVLDHGVGVDRLEVHRPDGVLLQARPTVCYCGSEWPGFTGIARSDLHAILAKAARDAGATLLPGTELAELDEVDGSILTGSGSRLSADLLVCADGIYSRARAQLFPGHAQPVRTGEAVWRARLPGLRGNRVQMMFGAGVGTIGITPLKHDTYFYVVDRADRAPPRAAADLADRLVALVGHVPGFPAALARRISHAPGDVTYRELETVVLPQPWFKGRALLIGDAAHAGPPTLAQGAAMGIEDAVVLAELAAREGSVPALLDAFMARRWPRVSAILDASITISRAQLQLGGQQAMADANAAASAVLALPY